MNWTEVVTHSLSANWYSYCYYYYTSRRKTRKNKHKQKNKNSSKKISRNVYLLPVNVISFTFLSPCHVLTISIEFHTNKDKERWNRGFSVLLRDKSFYWFYSMFVRAEKRNPNCVGMRYKIQIYTLLNCYHYLKVFWLLSFINSISFFSVYTL